MRKTDDSCEDCPLDQDVHLWPENSDVACLFVACASQVRVNEGAILGIDYNAVKNVSEWMGIQIDSETFDLLRVCEAAYASQLNSQIKRNDGHRSTDNQARRHRRP